MIINIITRPKFRRQLRYQSIFTLIFFAMILHTANAQQRLIKTPDETGPKKSLSTLSSKLQKKDCWLLSKYFAHKTLDSFTSQVEIAKYGGNDGYYSDFNCGTALKYWERKLTTDQLQIILPNGLRFIQQQQLLEGGQQKLSPSTFVNQNKNQFDQNSTELDGLNDRVAKFDPDQLNEFLNEKTEVEETVKFGLDTLIMFILIGMVAIGILIATCLAYFRCRCCRDDELLDENPSEETIPEFVASGLSGVSGEGKTFGSSDSIKPTPKASRTRANAIDLNHNNQNNNVVIDLAHVRDDINQNFL